MFLCLPEHKTDNQLLEKLFPVPEGGGHWGVVIKENLRPMFIVTIVIDTTDGSDEQTFVASDAFAILTFCNLQSNAQITAFDCIFRAHRTSSWTSRSVAKVWTVDGHEMMVSYLEFHDEPGALFDTFTLGLVSLQNARDKKPLLTISPMLKNRKSTIR